MNTSHPLYCSQPTLNNIDTLISIPNLLSSKLLKSARKQLVKQNILYMSQLRRSNGISTQPPIRRLGLHQIRQRILETRHHAILQRLGLTYSYNFSILFLLTGPLAKKSIKPLVLVAHSKVVILTIESH